LALAFGTCLEQGRGCVRRLAMPGIWLGFIGAFVVLPAAAAEKRLMTVSDLDRIKTVGRPDVDPGGSWIAYSIAEVDAAADKNVSHIWMTSWDGARMVQLTSRKGESETTPRWSPDGRFLAFISARDDEKERDQLWLLDRAGGEAKRPTELNGSVVDYAWSPNGKQIALIVLDPNPDEEADAAAQAPQPATVKPGETQGPQTSPEQPRAADELAASTAKKDEKRPKPIVIDRFQFKTRHRRLSRQAAPAARAFGSCERQGPQTDLRRL
jgi:dipeptidyl aminopeptidase/acylaminoacyl peptidase